MRRWASPWHERLGVGIFWNLLRLPLLISLNLYYAQIE
ncbi:Uncharacterised protein [Salmonella enterica subsp. enterica serovar Typhimurium]|nr:Uncharacterised protein [Salmonella enterica subsp. enterica serovar Typhimurium]